MRDHLDLRKHTFCRIARSTLKQGSVVGSGRLESTQWYATCQVIVRNDVVNGNQAVAVLHQDADNPMDSICST